MNSKLDFDGVRLPVGAENAVAVMTDILTGLGCARQVADAIAVHLADASLCGVESHGVMRILQYARQFRSGYMSASGEARVTKYDGQFLTIDGGGGHGIPAMQLAFDTAIEAAVDKGMSVTAITNLGHTGRHGAFAELAAEAGMLSLLIGGGNRAVWRQVAPHGGAEAKLPTNPWCLGLPGGGDGPFILDFATSTVAGGWIYAAESAGAQLPEGCLIDADGNPTTDPKAYFEGGAILPAAGQKGYALALAAELIAEALIGPVATEANWLLIMVDTTRMTGGHILQERAEGILADIRACRPFKGFEKVEIPGERERQIRDRAGGVIHVPEKTWIDILTLREKVGMR